QTKTPGRRIQRARKICSEQGSWLAVLMLPRVGESGVFWTTTMILRRTTQPGTVFLLSRREGRNVPGEPLRQEEVARQAGTSPPTHARLVGRPYRSPGTAPWRSARNLLPVRPGSSPRWPCVRCRHVAVPPVRPPRHQRAQVHAQLVNRRTAQVPPAVVSLEDHSLRIEHECIWNRDARMVRIRRVHDVQLSDHL